MRILHSSYACYPGAGSEPGVGWNMALETSKYHEVWVVTLPNAKERIEAYTAHTPGVGESVDFWGENLVSD